MRAKVFCLLPRKTPRWIIRSSDDIYVTGTLANILQMLKMPDGTVKVLVEGEQRANVLRYTHDQSDDESCVTAESELVVDQEMTSRESDVLIRTVSAEFEKYVKLNPKIPPEILTSLGGIDNLGTSCGYHCRAFKS